MRPGRRVPAVLLSVAVVAVPAGATTAVGGQAVGLLGSGAVATDVAQALLLLACVALTAVLLWATAAAVAGVREGWQRAATGAGRGGAGTVTAGAGLDAVTRDRCGPAPGRARRATPDPARPVRSAGSRTGGVITTTVAALVVAALSAGPAAATATDGPAPAPTAATAETLPPGSAPGSWSALAEHPATDGSGSPPATGAATGTYEPDPDVTTARQVEPAPDPVATAAGPTTGAESFRAPRVVDPATASLVTGGPGRAAVEREVVVRAGDSLWALAAAHLGPGATDAEVADAWPSWWQANRHTIGDDPDLLRPGQRLVVPLR